MQNQKRINAVFAGLAFVVALITYLRTIAPTVSFWDCGEFITCSYILGIPHPPGAPFYLLIGRLFSMIPFVEDIALRVNVISALASAFTVLFTYLIIVRLIKQWRGEPKSSSDLFILIASGLMGALSYAFTDTFWFNAVEAEVYAISMFFTSIIVWLILIWLEKADQVGSERYLLFIAYLVGLAMGVHLLMILCLPAISLLIYYHYLDRHNKKVTVKNLLTFALIVAGGFFVIYPGVVQWIPRMAGALGIWSLAILFIALIGAILYALRNHQKVLSLALMAVLLVITGYSTYTLIYIRSGLDPAVDENNPENIENMVKYLNREQYGKWGTFPRRYPGLPSEYQFEHQYPNRNYATFNLGKQLDFMWEYQIKKMYVRYFAWQFIGKGTTLGEDGYIKKTLSTRGLFALPFLLGLMGMVHHFYRHKRHAFVILGIFILTGIAIIIYLNQPDPQPRERDYVYVGSFFAFAIWIGMGLTALLEWIQEGVKSGWQRKAFMGVCTVALFIIAPINLYAFNYHEHDRSGNYVAHDYSYNILQSCKPNSIIFTNGDNDTFPLWYLQYVEGIRQDVRVVNLSLLNTPWYIKQLKYREPRVPISLSDQVIESLEVVPWKKQTIRLEIPRSMQDSIRQELDALGESDVKVKRSLAFEVEPTLFGQAIRVQDYMILNILHANKWEYPVYFAVTVSSDNKLNLGSYLRMDGLAFRLMPYKAQHVDTEVLQTNLFEKFKLRNLDDPDVYYNHNIVGLLQNYRAGFLRLAREYLLNQEYDRMAEVLDRMEEKVPEKTVPIPDYRLSLQIGQMYDLAGRRDEYINRLRAVIEKDPENTYSYATLVSALSQSGQHEEAIELLEGWLARHPDDQEARRRLEAERQKLVLENAGDSDSTVSAE
jgi:pentatricopeptide repeat protein